MNSTEQTCIAVNNNCNASTIAAVLPLYYLIWVRLDAINL